MLIVPQYTGETLGQADRTELDPGLEELLTRADATKTWTDKIISQTEVLLQPNPGERLLSCPERFRVSNSVALFGSV